MGANMNTEVREASPEEVNFFWNLDAKRPYTANAGIIDLDSFKQCFR